MKVLTLNKAPYSAALYLRKCEEKKSNKLAIFERAYHSACLAVAGVASVACLVAAVNILLVLIK